MEGIIPLSQAIHQIFGRHQPQRGGHLGGFQEETMAPKETLIEATNRPKSPLKCAMDKTVGFDYILV